MEKDMLINVIRKKTLFVAAVVGAIGVMSVAEASEVPSCSMPTNQGTHKQPFDFFSGHGAQITNTTGSPVSYKIKYHHEITNAISNNLAQDITLQPGESFSEANYRFVTSNVRMPKQGRYPSRAVTEILKNGKLVKSCVDEGIAIIY